MTRSIGRETVPRRKQDLSLSENRCCKNLNAAAESNGARTFPIDGALGVTDNTTGSHFLFGLNTSYDLSRVGTSAISYDTLGRRFFVGFKVRL